MNSKYVYIGLAAIIGTSLRAGIGLATEGFAFPYSTLLINIVASYALVLLYEVFRKHELINPLAITAIGTGLIGSFSTMSAVAYDTVNFIEQGLYVNAAANYALNMTLCLLAAAAAYLSARKLTERFVANRRA